MREILFRGKNADNGEWVYGSYFAHQKIRLCIVRGESEVEKNTQHLIVQDALACDWGFKNGIQAVDVLPETVGQYTGLTDKNGKKIFEGDIIICDTSMYRHVTGIVKYSENASRYYIEVLNSSNDYLFNCENILIIGNIHDNPELLEEKS